MSLYNEQMKYKHVIVALGWNIADRYPFQLHFKSVVFHAIEPNMSHLEYCYYNLETWQHYTPFTNVTQIIEILKNIYHDNR